jgi:anti-sigma B factor antagonist
VKPASDERTPGGGEYLAQGPDREQLLAVRLEDHTEAVILTVTGDIDGLTAPRLRAGMAEAFDRLAGRALVVDLTSVRFLGSPGLRALRDSAEEAVHHHGTQPLRIVVDNTRPVVRPIEIVGLDQILALYENVDDALAGDTLQQG